MNNIGKIMLLGVFALTTVFGLAGCGGGTNTTSNTTKTTTDNKTTTTTDNKGTTTNTTTTTTTNKTETSVTTAESIGVPECDDFIKKYDACISGKVPEASRAQYKASIDGWRSSWKKLAENPQTKGTLADACKRSLEETKKSMASFSCEW